LTPHVLLSTFDATAVMALPLRCAASLGLADTWPINPKRSLTVAGWRPEWKEGSPPASRRLAAHRSGRAIAL